MRPSQGLAASRVESEDACLVSRLVNSFDERVAFIEAHQVGNMSVESDVEVQAVPFDETVDFCGDLPVYELVREEEEEERAQHRRLVSVNFRRCVLLFPCLTKCFITTIGVSTGSNIYFGWHFFG